MVWSYSQRETHRTNKSDVVVFHSNFTFVYSICLHCYVIPSCFLVIGKGKRVTFGKLATGDVARKWLRISWIHFATDSPLVQDCRWIIWRKLSTFKSLPSCFRLPPSTSSFFPSSSPPIPLSFLCVAAFLFFSAFGLFVKMLVVLTFIFLFH